MEKNKVEIPITEYDLEMLKEVVYDNTTFTWIYTDQNGNEVELEFMNNDEYLQRGK